MLYIGVDGCKAGWFFTRSNVSKLDFGVCTSFEDIVNMAGTSPDGAQIMVDIPIGLRDDTCEHRICDRDARRVLGKRRNSVFTPPVREILQERTHAEATAKSNELIGKGITLQTFGIMPKILEVDELIVSSANAQYFMREIHPEVCFWGLNNGTAMTHSKKTMDGFCERMELIKTILPEAGEMVEQALDRHRRKDVARDDIADALVALITAMAPADKLQTLPEVPETDSRGIPMEMVYRCADTLKAK